MHIANPIYDIVFKYLMEDSKIAKLVIGTIIECDITELTFFPQEHTSRLDKPSLTIYRLDFSATIKTADGPKQILIEIQKAKFATDIMRFRRYLGAQYASRTAVHERKPLPIISIYFLGYPLGDTTAPLIKVQRHLYDVLNNHQQIEKKIDFIESLTHDSFIIQIPYLSRQYSNDIECLLSVFDQHQRTQDHHVLNVKEDNFPEKYRPIIRRLQTAVAEQEVREVMEMEDDFLEELQNKEREIADKDKALEESAKSLAEKDESLKLKDKSLEEKNKSLEQKDKSLEEKDKSLEQKDKSLEEKSKSLEEKDDLIATLKREIERLK